MAGECRLVSLPPVLLGHLWPAERGVVGLRVCKQLRRDLLCHCTSILLVAKADAMVCEDAIDVRKALNLLPPHLMVSLRWKNTSGFVDWDRIEALGECKALAHLDLSCNRVCDEYVKRLAGGAGEVQGPGSSQFEPQQDSV
eukprot:3021150-Rhodomonas_salina.3